MYASAGKLVRVAMELGWSMNHLTSVLNRRDGEPVKYWRIGMNRFVIHQHYLIH